MVLRLALALVALAAAGPAASQRQAPTVLHVSAEVRPSALLRLEARPASVAISDADIARGYVDVPTGALLSLDTGRLRPSVAAEIPSGAGPFRSVEVRTLDGWPGAGAGLALGPASLDQLPATGAVRRQSPAPALREAPGGITSALVYRFTFSEKAAPGTYQVPVTLSIGL